MRIRTQLVLCFIALSVVPLIAIVTWSYYSSTRAVTEAVLAEAEESTRGIESRLQIARNTLQNRFAELARDTPPAQNTASANESDVAREIAVRFGDLAPTLDSIVVIPPSPPAPPATEGDRDELVSTAAAPLPPAPVRIDIDSMLADLQDIEQFEHGDTLRGVRNLDPGMKRQIDEQVRRSIETARQSAESIRAGQEEIARARTMAIEQRRIAQQQAQLLLGDELRHRLPDGREVVARVHPEQFLRTVLVGRSDDVAFALDEAGNLYTADDQAQQRIDGLPLQHTGAPGVVTRVEGDWVLATAQDPNTGLTFGIAHPVKESLARLRRTAGINLGAGLGVVGLALLIIVPIANHVTRDLEDVTDGARRIAAGEIGTEVPVRSQNEVGQLALAFNQMSHELEQQRQHIAEQEELRREQAVRQRLLEADHARKTAELEDARRFQLSLLPRTLPSLPHIDVAVHMQTATEVGGDYYDVVPGGDGIVVAVGDATGHGARAGTMVTVVKSLFTAHGDRLQPGAFLAEADRAIGRMDLGRMAMALAIARISRDAVTIASAGMPPLLIRRATGLLEEYLLPGTPLGTLGGERLEKTIPLSAGDTLLFMSDGFAEMCSAEGEPLGYVETTREFTEAASDSHDASEVIGRLRAKLDGRLQGKAPEDDVTFVVVRIG